MFASLIRLASCLGLLLTLSCSYSAAQDPDDEPPPPPKVSLKIRVSNGTGDTILIYKLGTANPDGTGRGSQDWKGTPQELESGKVSVWELMLPKRESDAQIYVKYFQGTDLNPATGTLRESKLARPNLKLTTWNILLE